METVETNDTKGWIIGALVLVVVVVGGWWMIKNSKASSTVVGDAASTTEETTGDNMVNVVAMNDDTAAPTPTPTPTHPAVTTEARGESVTMQDQSAGTEATIASMKLSAASWVAIKDAKGVLGAAWYPSYATKGSVSLLRKTVAGTTYQAVVYVDDGDKKFDMHKDTLVTGVGSSFVAK
ncbi:hypothetical protein HZC00_00125 [Candidatus Kaiserbacteria bacterium]|nr:hypothetical protein [Candidatus Kaiserbacteria bacterium]